MRTCRECGKTLINNTKSNRQLIEEYPEYFKDFKVSKTCYCSQECKRKYKRRNIEKMINTKICPNCKKEYTTTLIRRKINTPIQKEYPKATPEEREQHISGICSNKCWKEYLFYK